MDIPRTMTATSASTDDLAAAVEAAIKAQQIASYVALVEATGEAVKTLIHVAMYGKHEEARVSAAKEILDRADLGPDIRVTITGADSDRELNMDELRKQLDHMQIGLTTPLTLTAETEVA